MSIRDEIVAEARTWLGTPFKHQGRLKGIGGDCVGLLIGIARAKGLSDYAVSGYSTLPSQHQFYALLEEACGAPIAREALDLGDILTFRMQAFQHVGVISCLDPMRVIHITAQFPRKCVEYTFPPNGENDLGLCFRFPGVSA